MTKEDNSDSDDGPSRVNSLQLLNAIKAENGVPRKGLVYVAAPINGKMIFAMMDTGASDNFISKTMIKSLGLNVSEHSSQIKVVNSQAQPILGLAYAVDVKKED